MSAQRKLQALGGGPAAGYLRGALPSCTNSSSHPSLATRAPARRRQSHACRKDPDSRNDFWKEVQDVESGKIVGKLHLAITYKTFEVSSRVET
eukprot:CAMPEP_0119477432 /NCGR_PEP_ID=MMETSP1344-20130328/7567_1 /TAXON_ID=236787 /ORGANISM="Florenciella parvula, Strain CCMP2471" /LENGTH=92 /DNA_ID=CAMNT_0007511403 /DNA_START=87 /DNA_END=365 /DNA_ORIENTATION=+